MNSNWSKSLAVVFGLMMVATLISSSTTAQDLNVRTERAPHFVGKTIVLQVEAINFKIEPAVEIKNSQQENVTIVFANSSQSSMTQIFNGVRKDTVKTTFSYRVLFTKAGKYTIGPFVAKEGNREFTHPSIEFTVTDIKTTDDMKVEIEFPDKNIYPGQRVPIKLRWIYAGDPGLVRRLTIRNELFEQYQFEDYRPKRNQTLLPVSTSKEVFQVPATLEQGELNGKRAVVATAERILIPEKAETVNFPKSFVSFHKVVDTVRSGGIFPEVREVTVPYKGIGERVSFTVKPYPAAGRPDSFDGAVGSAFTISTSSNRTNFRTGDPLTMQINIEGEGNIEAIGVPRLDHSFSAEDFDWPTGELPGVTKGSQKQFSINLRAKNETLTEIPAVEFSYFDPDKEEYVTVRSKPIPIEVSKGEVVSSKDVVGQISNSSDSIDVSNGLDLAIETDVDKLVRSPLNWQWLEYAFYVFGIVLIGVALFVPQSASRKTRVKSEKKQLAEWRAELNELLKSVENKGAENKGDQERTMISKLSDHLRQLQNILGRAAQNEGRLDSSSEQALDELIGEIDKVAYRQSSPTKDEFNSFIQKANKISGELF